MNDINFTYTEGGKLVINYGLNEDNTFNFWQVYPIDDDLPKLEVENLEEAKTIKLGVTKLINGEIIQPKPEEPPTMTDEQLTEATTIRFRHHREYVFKNGFDIWEKAVLRGREEDSGEVMSWYQTMLDFTDQITKDTTHEDYPEVPEKLKYYIG